MGSIFEKNKVPVLCVIITALLISIGVIYLTYSLEAYSSTYVSADAVADAEKDDVRTSPVDITIKADGLTMEFMAAKTTVRDVLKKCNIKVGKDDIVLPGLESPVEDDMEIIVQRVKYKEQVVMEEIPYKSKTKGVDDLPAGTSKVAVKGEQGQDEVVYRIKYVDGKKDSVEEISRTTVKEPVTEIIEKSTVGTIKGKEYSKKFTVKAYSYTGGGRTASGKPAAVGRIAVDRRVIPLGTKVYVEGYGFAEAADTGGNIKGNTIDVYFNSVGQCRSWGVRHVTIYILK